MRTFRVGSLMLVAAILLGVYLVRSGGFSSPAPAFTLPEPDGGQVDLASYAGRPVLLVFWTTSCPICQRELPMLNQMEPEFRARGISVLTICLGGEAEARSYLDSNRIGLRSVYDERGQVGHAYNVSGVPGLVLVDKDGRIRQSATGWTSDKLLRNWMDAG